MEEIDVSKTGRKEDTKLVSVRVPLTCKCSALKCGSHISTGSKWFFGIGLFLFLWSLVILSGIFTNQHEEYAKIEVKYTAELQALRSKIDAFTKELAVAIKKEINKTRDTIYLERKVEQDKRTEWFEQRQNEWWGIMPHDSQAWKARQKAIIELEARKKLFKLEFSDPPE